MKKIDKSINYARAYLFNSISLQKFIFQMPRYITQSYKYTYQLKTLKTVN